MPTRLPPPGDSRNGIENSVDGPRYSRLGYTAKPARRTTQCTASQTTHMRSLILFATFASLACGSASATVFPAGPDNYVKLVRLLKPGDTLSLAPGSYRDGLPVHGLHGTRDAPIVIEGPAAGPPAILFGRPGANTVSIGDASHVEIRNLRLDGLGLHADAVKAEKGVTLAHHIVLSGLTIVGHDADQQIVGISTKRPTYGWVIRDNAIIGAGTGIYLGDSDGSAPFVGGLIEHNVISGSLGYNIQIKHQNSRPASPDLPSKPAQTVIRHNVFSKDANSSAESLARPNMLVGHFPPQGTGSDDCYVIYGNFFYQNPHEVLVQGEGNIAFYSNVLVNTAGSAVAIQPHHGRPRDISIFNNTILARDRGIGITGAAPEFSQRVAGNLVFAQTPITGGEQTNNVIAHLSEAAKHLMRPDAPLGELDLAPRADRTWPKIPAPADAGLADSDRDFDGRYRKHRTPGAYDTSNVIWRLRLERKPVMEPMALIESSRHSRRPRGRAQYAGRRRPPQRSRLPLAFPFAQPGLIPRQTIASLSHIVHSGYAGNHSPSDAP